jgi:hypothetical protein
MTVPAGQRVTVTQWDARSRLGGELLTGLPHSGSEAPLRWVSGVHVKGNLAGEFRTEAGQEDIHWPITGPVWQSKWGEAGHPHWRTGRQPSMECQNVMTVPRGVVQHGCQNLSRLRMSMLRGHLRWGDRVQTR